MVQLCYVARAGVLASRVPPPRRGARERAARRRAEGRRGRPPGPAHPGDKNISRIWAYTPFKNARAYIMEPGNVFNNLLINTLRRLGATYHPYYPAKPWYIERSR